MPKKIRVSDIMQKGYSYDITSSCGRGFDKEFKPELTPRQMLEMGVFEGKYLNDCKKEFPKSWFTRKALEHMNINADVSLNFFKVKSRQSLQEWQRKGWIYGKDVRGWFQWYCRYYYGRRDEEIDKIQIKRWKNYQHRHKGSIRAKCKRKGHKLDKNGYCSKYMECSPKERQGLLQWAYNPINVKIE